MSFLENPPKVFASKEERQAADYAKRFAKRYLESGKINKETLTSDEKIKEALEESGIVKEGAPFFGEVIKMLRSMQAVPEAVVVKKEKPIIPIKEPEFIPVEIPKKELHFVEDTTLLENFATFQRAEDLKEEKGSIMENEEEVNAMYLDALTFEKERNKESDDYYLEFAKLGLVKRGAIEVRKDLTALRVREKEFSENIMKQKKIATMTEIGLDYVVSELRLYGENIRIGSTSKYDDIMRGVDSVMEFVAPGTQTEFLGMGIDVTYTGLRGRGYEDKIFKLLSSIRNNEKTKVKYYTNSNGEPVEEFPVPKIVLSFDVKDVRNLMYLLKNTGDTKAKQEFIQSAFKDKIMNQIIMQCEKLSHFAKQHDNTISVEYDRVLQALTAIAEKNLNIKGILDVRHTDEVSRRFSGLLKKFEDEA